MNNLVDYCCNKYKWLIGHDYIFEDKIIRHMDSEEYFCCNIDLIYCPFCGTKLGEK